jgi:hypothetical protein
MGRTRQRNCKKAQELMQEVLGLVPYRELSFAEMLSIEP